MSQKYIQSELFRIAPLPVNSENFPYGFSMQIRADGIHTKWLQITPEQFKKIEEFLIDGE